MSGKCKSKEYVHKINAALYEQLAKGERKTIDNFTLTMMLKEHFITSKKEFESAHLRVSTNLAGENTYEIIGRKKQITQN